MCSGSPWKIEHRMTREKREKEKGKRKGKGKQTEIKGKVRAAWDAAGDAA